MVEKTDWSAVSECFNGMYEEKTPLLVKVYSRAQNKTLEVIIPEDRVENFLDRLGLYEAQVKEGNAVFVEKENVNAS
jgi:hypothetical protein